MTVISDTIRDIAGADNQSSFTFTALGSPERGGHIVTRLAHRYTATAGVLTTADLDPGPALVEIGRDTYRITIPDSESPVRLGPLILAGLPQIVVGARAVVDGGGAAILYVMSSADYSALIAVTTPDPGSIFYVY